MKDELSKQLYEGFPRFFNRQSPPVRGGFWGFECRDGWFNILMDLCGRLSTVVDEEFKVLQVKEKFGTLRFYVFKANDTARELIRRAEVESSHTCEECGSLTGTLRGEGWMKILCNHCDKARSSK